MQKSNPVIIPRNLLVEEALEKASNEDDYLLFNELLEYLGESYNYKKPIPEKFTKPKESNEKYITYCGT